MVYIYGLIDPISNEIRYIGKTINLKQRFMNHLNDSSITYKTNWIKKLLNKGTKPKIIILEKIKDNEIWQEKEKFYIKKYRDMGYKLVNCTDGGDGVLNISGEGKIRMLNTWKGRKHKEETKIKIGLKSKGRKHSKEWKNNMSKIMKGREITWSKKLRKPHKEELKTSVYQFTKDGAFIKQYNSAWEAECATGVYNANIGKCCRGERKLAGNYKWSYNNV